MTKISSWRFFQHQIRIRRGRPVGAFREHPAFQVFPPRARRSHVSIAAGTSTSQGSVRIWSGSNVSSLEKPAMLPYSPACRISAGNVEAGPLSKKRAPVCDRRPPITLRPNW